MKSANLSRRPMRGAGPALRGLVFMTAGMLMAATVQASSLAVHVKHKTGGGMLGEAAVCIGSGSDADQFGSAMTGSDGVVTFDQLPRTEVHVTVSRDGYRGETRIVPVLRRDHVVVVDLATGGGGPVCGAQGADARGGNGQFLRITDLRLRREGKGRTVMLGPEVEGDATHYRASESSDFSGAAWQPWKPWPEFTMSQGKGIKTIYFQMRRYRELDGSSLESLSNVYQVRAVVQ